MMVVILFTAHCLVRKVTGNLKATLAYITLECRPILKLISMLRMFC